MENDIIDIEKYLNNANLFDKISDITRIVDPLRKKVIKYRDDISIINEIHCFDFWGKNRICDNCISMRAYNDNATYVKIEYKKDKAYMITAIPHTIDDKKIVIEMIKDVTNSILFNSTENILFDQTDIHTLIDNMNKLAFEDPLTGIYNRRYIMEKLPVDLINTAFSSNAISIIMTDIDYFKRINDNYGHIAGDKVLKNTAEKLLCCIRRDSDWIARFGGEEFMICMPGADNEIAKKTAECMRKLLENSIVEYDGKKINVTASFGIYTAKAADIESVEDLLKRADEKLYMAKEKGRNRVEN